MSSAETMEAKRKFYLSPDSAKVTVEGCTDEMGVGYVTPTPPGSKYPATYAVWFGKAGKPSAYYAAKSMEAAKLEVEKSLKDAALVAAAKAGNKAKKAEDRKTWDAAKTLPVGTLLSQSGGWEQTNVSGFKVVAVVSRTVVDVVGVGLKSTGAGPGPGAMSDHVVLDPKEVLNGGAITRMKLSSPDSVAVPSAAKHAWGKYAYKWDGRELYRSWHA